MEGKQMVMNIILCLLVMMVDYVSAISPDSIMIRKYDDCKSRNFVKKRQTYIFTAYEILDKCNFDITIPSYYGSSQYCVTVDHVNIDESLCPMELKIYEGLVTYGKTATVHLTCDSQATTKEPICVSGVGNGIFIVFKTYRKSRLSRVHLKVTYGPIPRTTTVITPNTWEDGGDRLDMSLNMVLMLTLVISGTFVVIIVCYCCCCRKRSSSGTVIRQPQNRRSPRRQAASAPLQQSHIQPSAPDPYPHTYAQGPPSYDNITNIPLTQPTAPPLESSHYPHDPMISDAPPSYESVILNKI
ncbi:unnamed protein product [Mytilus edulis]|uniref:Uncharacterized protein n=1 Tax=Mytilus edulis TaxID=6550 RepID=A0A8S3V3A3_MYTED|nr:unnamed protein product [Mytilus edulis]